MLTQRVLRQADEYHRLAEQRVQRDSPGRLVRASGQGDVQGPVADRVHQSLGSGLGLAQFDDHARVMLADVGEDTSEVKPPRVHGASQRDSAADLSRNGGYLVPRGL